MMIQSVLHAQADSTNSDYRLAPQVIFLRLQDGSARLLDLGGNFYAISQTGAQMLYETLTMGTATVATRLATEYHAELSQVHNDLQAFLRDLEQKRIISHKKRSRGTFQKKNTFSLLILMLLLHCISVFPNRLERKAWALLTLASVSIRIFGWPKTIAGWHSSLQKHVPSGTTTQLEQTVREIDEVVRSVAARHLLHVECKERALSCWWLLSSAGFSAQLVLGVNLFPLECHCWCETGPFVLSDDRDWCEQFTPVVSYESIPSAQREENVCE
jgi:Transglutaminase-like superfamily